ncbi:SdpI family protein [Paenibacillus sedimenti]|uniref:SdpI family protein n=1 Tax=Paenibacillus sedimenti TaxID=2770274 RepID=A0A926KPS5_9BACL|nr:SdpI family protein [Paenibacillus sedimenti]MBD0381660.1 SdpI family protein [Paenibacillus sedimenti]
MNKNTKILWGWKDAMLLLIVLVPVIMGAVMYEDLPDQLASHFDLKGNTNGFMSKSVFIISMSLINFILFICLKVVPRLDPKQGNYAKFMDVYELFRFVIVTFLTGIFVMVLFYNRGYDISMNTVLFLFMGVLWIILGNYMGRIRRNYTLGVRTPWTLANEEVWKKTHRLTGPLWVICGFVMLVCSFFGDYPLHYVLLSIIGISVVVPTIYSYLVFNKLGDGKEK